MLLRKLGIQDRTRGRVRGYAERMYRMSRSRNLLPSSLPPSVAAAIAAATVRDFSWYGRTPSLSLSILRGMISDNVHGGPYYIPSGVPREKGTFKDSLPSRYPSPPSAATAPRENASLPSQKVGRTHRFTCFVANVSCSMLTYE